MTVNEIKNVREIPETEGKTTAQKIWEAVALFCLTLTVLGQVVIGAWYLVAQAIWLTANVLTLCRDFALNRPAADKIKNACLTGLTVGLIALRVMGIY